MVIEGKVTQRDGWKGIQTEQITGFIILVIVKLTSYWWLLGWYMKGEGLKCQVRVDVV